MGLTQVTVALGNLMGTGDCYEEEFLVDTGGIDCLAPASALVRAGIVTEGRDVYELANGEVVEYPYGFARVTFMGAETVSKVIFGPDECEPLLGVVALESTGIGVDPVSRTLKRMAAKPLK
ncbi:clan AA aspartic protease [Magnetovirga frankeli]|nr:clan AA aspartic protease [gamma proteobacterium SS-5]